MVDTSDAIREQTVSALKGSVVEQQFEIVALRSRITALEAERDRLSALVYVPGLWHCPKCKFQLMQANLNAHSGTVTPRDQPGDKCPNCDSPLWRVSERDARNEMVNRCEQACHQSPFPSLSIHGEREMTKPVRIQLKRTKGWTMPPNTVKVDRLTKWGNYFRVGEPLCLKTALAWGLARRDFANPHHVCKDTTEAVRRFAACLAKDEAIHEELRRELRGKNLACWCPLDAPCHADVLLKFANAPDKSTENGNG